MSKDIQTGLDLQIKRPGEYYPFTFNFPTLKNTEVISSISSVNQVKRGLVTASIDLVIDGLSNDAADNAQAWVNGGTDGEIYVLTCTVITSIGATRTCSGVIKVRNAY